jgi:signal transduction histidine kinase
VQTAARLQNRAHFQFERVRLEDVGHAAQRRLQPMAEARQVRVELDTQTKLPPIWADATQLAEGIYHLLHNAIKFNRVGGVVNMVCGIEGSDVYLRIIDQGVGIPEKQLDDLWIEFPALQTVPQNGNGKRPARLGLTLTQFVVRAHGGRIEAESKYGSGSVFTLYLPLELVES